MKKMILSVLLLAAFNAQAKLQPLGAPVDHLCGVNVLESSTSVAVGEICFGRLSGTDTEIISVQNARTSRYFVYKIIKQTMGADFESGTVEAVLVGTRKGRQYSISPVKPRAPRLKGTLRIGKTGTPTAAWGRISLSNGKKSVPVSFEVMSFEGVISVL